MLVTALVDPSALEPKYMQDEAYKIQVDGFLAGILQNGLLISDRDGILLNRMGSKIKMLSRAQKIQIRFEEVLKNKGRWIVKYKFPTTSQNTNKICYELERHRPPDVIIAGPDYLREFQSSCSESKVITFEEYSSSEFEEQRTQYMTALQPLHELEFDECKELFIRVVKFAKFLRIYDKQIGKGRNLPGFRRGIHFILRLWQNHGYFFGEKTAGVQIYTCRNELKHPSEKNEVEKAKSRINKFLINKLEKEFDVPIELFMKRDRSREIHARYLQTQSTIILMERGFDFLKNNNEVKQTEIQLKPNSAGHLENIRNLPDL